MTFQLEAATDALFDELWPLLELHYDEIAHFKDIPLDPDWDGYMAINANGALRIFTARDEAKDLIGYAVFFVKHNLHYKSSLQALQDILFVDPKRRGFGMKFIDWCDGELRKEGIQAVYHHVKKAHNFGPMLERLDYHLVDLIYSRRL